VVGWCSASNVPTQTADAAVTDRFAQLSTVQVSAPGLVPVSLYTHDRRNNTVMTINAAQHLRVQYK